MVGAGGGRGAIVFIHCWRGGLHGASTLRSLLHIKGGW